MSGASNRVSKRGNCNDNGNGSLLKADPNIVNEVRAALVSNLKWAVKNKAKFGYVEKRPMVSRPTGILRFAYARLSSR